MTVHRVKSWAHLFVPFLRGEKTHDLRIMDRDYKVGDILQLCEYDKCREQFTGREASAEITHITSRDNVPCAFSNSVLHHDYGILSIRKIEP